MENKITSGRGVVPDLGQLLMVAEAAEDAVVNISLRADAIAWALDLRSLSESSHKRVEKLGESYRPQKMDTCEQLEGMTDKVESMYYQFALSDRQEEAISNTVRGAKDEVLHLFNKYGEDFDEQFRGIVSDLNRASTFQIDSEEEAAPAVQLF